MCWCYCGREYGRCGCCRVHHRPLPRPLSTPTNSHARSSIRRHKNAISPPPLLNPSHALHELSTMPSPPPTLPPTDRWVIGPQGRPVAPPTRTGLLLKRSTSIASASHQPSVKYPLTRASHPLGACFSHPTSQSVVVRRSGSEQRTQQDTTRAGRTKDIKDKTR